MGDNSSMKFLELLAEVCKGSEKSIGSPNDPQFWSLFAGKFSQILRSYWSPEFCESFATKLGMQYLNKDPCNYQLSSNFMNLLELVFVKYAHLLPTFAETQEDPDAIPETPPDKLNPGKFRLDELREATESFQWEDMFILYCRRVSIEYFQLAREITRVCMRVDLMNRERGYFVEELQNAVAQFLPKKMAEFSNELQRKDDIKLMELRILARELELRGREIDLFIEKIKGLLPW